MNFYQGINYNLFNFEKKGFISLLQYYMRISLEIVLHIITLTNRFSIVKVKKIIITINLKRSLVMIIIIS